jgi:enterochelin esterase-like enzyme
MRRTGGCALLFFIACFGQQPPQPVRSPEIDPAGRITFRLFAPKASQVLLRADFLKERQPLTRDEKGLWSVTLGPVEPDIYTYEFHVDGVRTIDPNNPSVKYTSRPSETSSQVEAPAREPMFYAARPSAHGVVQIHWYHSKSLETERRLHVYTPPGYERGSRRYPAIYLLHGAGGDDGVWVALGRVNLILDNLIAEGKLAPVVVVMPYGYAANPTPLSAAAILPPDRQRAGFERDLINDVIPYVQANYRVETGRENRAIAGLSMGGGQALEIGLKHPELFSRVAGFSSGLVRGVTEGIEKLAGNAKDLNEQYRLIWIGCGTEDRLYPANRQFSELLSKKGVQHTWKSTGGGHTWQVWRRYFHESAPLMFPLKAASKR